VLTLIVDGGNVYRLSWIQVHTSLMLPMNGYDFFHLYITRTLQ